MGKLGAAFTVRADVSEFAAGSTLQVLIDGLFNLWDASHAQCFPLWW